MARYRAKGQERRQGLAHRDDGDGISGSGVSVIYDRRNIEYATLISVSYHLIALVTPLLSGGHQFETYSLALFSASDSLLWTLLLVPVVGAFRKTIAWNDLYVWMSVLLFWMSCTVYLVFLLDPLGLMVSMNYGSSIFGNSSIADIALRLAEAELVIGIFALLVGLCNGRIAVPRKPAEFSRSHYRAMVITGLMASIGGIYGFLVLWSERSYAQTLFLQMGNVQNDIIAGAGRYFILQRIAVSAIPLGFIGWYRLRGLAALRVRNILALGAMLAAGIMPIVVFGSRIEVISYVLWMLIQCEWFGVRVTRGIAALLAAIVVVSVTAITLIRSNPYLKDYDVGQDFSLQELTKRYLESKGVRHGFLMDFDRVAPVALIIESLRQHGEYQYGETLLAGPARVVRIFDKKYGGGSGQLEDVNDFRAANSVIKDWRFGREDVLWAVPPSIPGELYMQYGYISLVVLALGCGALLRFVRRRIVMEKKLIVKWLLLSVCFVFVNNVTTETTPMFGAVLFGVIPVVFLYTVSRIIVGYRFAR